MVARTPPERRSPPTISHVAEEAGVSRATVSRAFSQPQLLSRDTVELVRSVAGDGSAVAVTLHFAEVLSRRPQLEHRRVVANS